MSATAGCHLRCTRMVPRQQGCHVSPQTTPHAGMMCRTAQLSHVAKALSNSEADDYIWPGHDAFDAEGDRQDEPPLPLPRLRTGKTITLVRHGQSQWNASGRIQGSCDLSLLTDKGRDQAEAARQQVLKLIHHVPCASAHDRLFLPCACSAAADTFGCRCSWRARILTHSFAARCSGRQSPAGSSGRVGRAVLRQLFWTL